MRKQLLFLLLCLGVIRIILPDFSRMLWNIICYVFITVVILKIIINKTISLFLELRTIKLVKNNNLLLKQMAEVYNEYTGKDDLYTLLYNVCNNYRDDAFIQLKSAKAILERDNEDGGLGYMITMLVAIISTALTIFSAMSNIFPKDNIPVVFWWGYVIYGFGIMIILVIQMNKQVSISRTKKKNIYFLSVINQYLKDNVDAN